jgi:hypothetical protein
VRVAALGEFDGIEPRVGEHSAERLAAALLQESLARARVRGNRETTEVMDARDRLDDVVGDVAVSLAEAGGLKVQRGRRCRDVQARREHPEHVNPRAPGGTCQLHARMTVSSSDRAAVRAGRNALRS